MESLIIGLPFPKSVSGPKSGSPASPAPPPLGSPASPGFVKGPSTDLGSGRPVIGDFELPLDVTGCSRGGSGCDNVCFVTPPACARCCYGAGPLRHSFNDSPLNQLQTKIAKNSSKNKYKGTIEQNHAIFFFAAGAISGAYYPNNIFIPKKKLEFTGSGFGWRAGAIMFVL